MKIDKIGIIIKTSKKVQCIDFYKKAFDLKIRFHSDFLCCFEFCDSYLMIEPQMNEVADSSKEDTLIRINVEDVKVEYEKLVAAGFHAIYNQFDWGSICTTYDPAGTKLELMDSGKFLEKYNEQHS
jgi:predicted enzyme related to lactoylglutathione lyase